LPFPIGLIGALILSSCVFGFAHLYQGVVGIVQTTILGAIFGLVFIVTGSLLLPMILHVLIDLRILLIWRAKSGSLDTGVSDASGT
jgi:membrane protease YdiL (CAAX protease family)